MAVTQNYVHFRKPTLTMLLRLSEMAERGALLWAGYIEAVKRHWIMLAKIIA